MTEFSGLQVTLVGLGTFGGGLGAARFLVRQGADLLITDLRREEDLGASLEALQGLPIRYRLGQHRDEDVLEADLVIFSPAIPPEAPILEAARRGGGRLSSPMNLAWSRLPERPVGVTGTRGKTTTTTLLHAMVSRRHPSSVLGGNIGGSLLDDVEDISPGTPVVLELSSAQLHWLRELEASPRISVITNFSEHHLEWHGTLEEYARAKRCILEYQRAGDVAVLNADDISLRSWGGRSPGKVVWFAASGEGSCDARVRDGRIEIREGRRFDPLLTLEEIPIPGNFQADNVMAAALAARALGVTPDEIREVVLGFAGLPHRLERIAVPGEAAFYNDSKATTPAAAAAAVESIPGPIHWIAGGKETGESFGPVAAVARGRVVRATLIGEAGPRIAGEIRDVVPDVVVCQTLEEAMHQVGEWTVLFSPGCPSYDQYLNYERRGDDFRRLSRRLSARGQRRS